MKLNLKKSQNITFENILQTLVFFNKKNINLLKIVLF